jgi:hypothetical protein
VSTGEVFRHVNSSAFVCTGCDVRAGARTQLRPCARGSVVGALCCALPAVRLRAAVRRARLPRLAECLVIENTCDAPLRGRRSLIGLTYTSLVGSSTVYYMW